MYMIGYETTEDLLQKPCCYSIFFSLVCSNTLFSPHPNCIPPVCDPEFSPFVFTYSENCRHERSHILYFGLSLSDLLTRLSHNFSTLKLFKHSNYPHSLLLTSLIMILGLSLDSDTQRQRHKFQIYDLHIINASKLF